MEEWPAGRVEGEPKPFALLCQVQLCAWSVVCLTSDRGPHVHRIISIMQCGRSEPARALKNFCPIGTDDSVKLQQVGGDSWDAPAEVTAEFRAARSSIEFVVASLFFGWMLK